MTDLAGVRLSRALPGAPPAAPIRIVHLGVGNFHRAHQAWYTWHAPDAADWGIAAFTGRRPEAADALQPQDGLYTLITRASAADTFELIGALSAVHPSAEHDRYLGYLRLPEVSVVTITVTEAGYLHGSDGRLNLTEDIKEDLAGLRRDPAAPVRTLPAKLVAGLLARRDAGAGPLTILSCDNLPHNGRVTRSVVTDFAAEVDRSLADWVEANIDFASSMVDRITPASTDEDRETVAAAQGYVDAAPVPTEPFSEWIVSGTFPAGRPAWEAAGAQVVADVAPYEQRKLWLLNGSHSLLAYAGSVRGHAFIDQAIADPDCRHWVELFWDEAERHLLLTGSEVSEYREALLTRYANPRIRHRLAQIAADGSTKLGVRILPALRAERASGHLPLGCVTALAAWVLHLRGHGAPVQDVDGDRFVAAAQADDAVDAVSAVLALLDPTLAADPELVDAIEAQAATLAPGADQKVSV